MLRAVYVAHAAYALPQHCKAVFGVRRGARGMICASHCARSAAVVGRQRVVRVHTALPRRVRGERRSRARSPLHVARDALRILLRALEPSVGACAVPPLQHGLSSYVRMWRVALLLLPGCVLRVTTWRALSLQANTHACTHSRTHACGKTLCRDFPGCQGEGSGGGCQDEGAGGAAALMS